MTFPRILVLFVVHATVFASDEDEAYVSINSKFL